MLDLGGADAVRQRSECAVGRGVAVAADDRGAGQRKALLGADDMDDALTLVELVVVFDAEILAVLASVAICSMLSGSGFGFVRSVVGTL